MIAAEAAARRLPVNGRVSLQRPMPSREFTRVSERGFALLTTLWLLVALSSVVGLSMAATRLGHQTTVNRILLARGRWAAEACLAIAQSRWAQKRFADTATIDLGQGKRCAWEVEDPTVRVNVNTAEVGVLKSLSAVSDQPSADYVIHVILERRRTAPFESTEELATLVTDSAMLALITVDGPGTVNAGAAPAAVLGALPGMTAEAVERVIYRRSVGRPIASLDELAGELSQPARAALLERYADLARVLTFVAPQLLVTAEGWVTEQGARSGSLRSLVQVLVVPLPDRLAVIRRRMW